ncbi:hypothetical protein [Streptomyces sp. NPDC047968]|uniref:hypothetical protein n=1 Tax=unclassified Streptomyces TaxID=2593676 RepID=UPI00343EE69A
MLQGDGPETLSYTIEFTNSGTFYTATLVVSDTTGSYQTQGVPLILTVQSLGNVVLTVPHWNFDNRVSYEKVTATDTQCQPGPLPGGGSVAPPTVTSFVIRPMNGAEIVLIRQS